MRQVWSVLCVPLLIVYTVRNESTYFLGLARARSENGWNVTESQPAVGLEVWIEAGTVFESKPDRPPPMLAII